MTGTPCICTHAVAWLAWPLWPAWLSWLILLFWSPGLWHTQSPLALLAHPPHHPAPQDYLQASVFLLQCLWGGPHPLWPCAAPFCGSHAAPVGEQPMVLHTEDLSAFVRAVCHASSLGMVSSTRQWVLTSLTSWHCFCTEPGCRPPDPLHFSGCKGPLQRFQHLP